MKNYLSVLFGLFALVNAENIVENVIVADQAYINAHPRAGKTWVETSTDGIVTKHYAGKGFEYHPDIHQFIPPKPYPSWVRDETKALYKAPVVEPLDGKFHKWDEATVSWKTDTIKEALKAKLDELDVIKP